MTRGGRGGGGWSTCVPVAERTPAGMGRALAAALKRSEYAELRLDFLRPRDVPAALALAGPVIGRCVCTLRPRSQGGEFAGTEAERASVLKMVAEYGPFRVDVESQTIARNGGLARYIRSTGTQILASWHDFAGTPSAAQLARRLKRMEELSDHVKIVTTARGGDDVGRILSLYSRSSEGSDLVAFAMGEAGRISRILCMYLGSPYTYAHIGRAVAPGQFSVDEVGKITSLIRAGPRRAGRRLPGRRAPRPRGRRARAIRV